MKKHWTNIAAQNYIALKRDTTSSGKRLNALYNLIGEWENGGLHQYLINSAGDSLGHVRDAFTEANFVDGLNWIGEINRKFLGMAPSSRNDRIRAILVLQEAMGGNDPFNSLDKELKNLIPQIDIIAEKLMALTKSVDPNKELSWNIAPSGSDWESRMPDRLKEQKKREGE